MALTDDKVYQPIPENRKTYDRLFTLYKKMHDSFGVRGYQEGLFEVMKELLAIRDEARKG
jgi:L-ribulokinase